MPSVEPLESRTLASVAGHALDRIDGFRVLVSAEVSNPAVVAEVTRQLDAIAREVRPRVLHQLRRVPIWVEADLPGATGATCYNPRDPAWLAAHGWPVAMDRAVTIADADHFVAWSEANQPCMILHELALARLDRTIGYGSPRLLRAYDAAVASGAYDDVPYSGGGTRRAWALQGPAEYFAEDAEAYVGGANDFYPFDRSELRRFDPAAFRLEARVWGPTWRRST